MSSGSAPTVQLTIDGTPVSVPAGTTIFDAARTNGIAIPTLCHQQNENPVGVCRVCVVDVGQRVYAASCIRPCEPNMKVQTSTDGVISARRTLVELLMSDDSSLAIAVDHEACILCDRCIRGCDDIRSNWVLARRGKGYQAGIAFDTNLPMGNSSCVSCGECMVSCPTGALTNKRVVGTELGTGDVVNPEELLD